MPRDVGEPKSIEIIKAGNIYTINRTIPCYYTKDALEVRKVELETELVIINKALEE